MKAPAGQESWETTYLQFFYKQALMNFMPKFSKSFWELSSRSDYQFTASPNHLLTLGGTASYQEGRVTRPGLNRFSLLRVDKTGPDLRLPPGSPLEW